ncbi:alpha/beta hydrolase fold domain-containing protein [Lacisediminihabitans sp. FW035]
MSGEVLSDIVFAELPGFRPLTLDLHLPSASPAPVILFVHGGGWRVGSRRVFGPNFTAAESFGRIVAAGFAVASVDYRLSGEAHFPAQVDDVRAALPWLREHASEHGLDVSRIVVWGESAGATIGALVALESDSGVLAVIDWYGPSDLVALAERADPETLSLTRESEWLGGTALELPAAARAASPLHRVHESAPPFLIAHGLDDAFVPVSQSEALADALRGAGVQVEFTTVPGANHLWNGVVDTAAILDRALDFAQRMTGSDGARIA